MITYIQEILSSAKTALTFKNINIIEGTELSGGISLTLWSVFGILD